MAISRVHSLRITAREGGHALRREARRTAGWRPPTPASGNGVPSGAGRRTSGASSALLPPRLSAALICRVDVNTSRADNDDSTTFDLGVLQRRRGERRTLRHIGWTRPCRCCRSIRLGIPASAHARGWWSFPAPDFALVIFLAKSKLGCLPESGEGVDRDGALALSPSWALLSTMSRGPRGDSQVRVLIGLRFACHSRRSLLYSSKASSVSASKLTAGHLFPVAGGRVCQRTAANLPCGPG